MGTLSVGRGRVLLALVIFVFVGVVAALVVRSLTAQAQQLEATAAAPSVAVLDFANNSGYGGDLLGRTAADALVLALDESRRFEPLERAQVDQEMARQGFTIPLNQTAQAKLGEQLMVTYVASGTINSVYFEQTNQGRVAMVDITVSLLSVKSGEFVNGARVTLGSTPKPGYTGDDAALVDEALTLATYRAVRMMISYRMPEATVLNATSDEVYLNAGSRSGLKEGMELVVMRFGEKVGRVRVISVEPTYATASIIATYRGITVGDTAIPVFAPPTAARAVAVRRAATRHKVSDTVLGLAAALGIFAAMSKNSPGEDPVPLVEASSLSDPTGVRKGVLVTWGAPTTQWRNVRAYEVWRNDVIIWVKPAAGGDPTGGGTFFIDEEMAQYDGIQWDVELSISADTGALVEYSFTAPESDDPPPGGGGAAGTFYERELIHTAPEAGQQYVYRILAIVADVTFTPGGEEEEEEATTAGAARSPAAASRLETFRQVAASRQQAPERQWVLVESPYAGASSAATYIEPPELVSPSVGEEVTDLTDVTFSWNAVAGADEYVLQISRDAFFLPATTRTFTAHEGVVAAGTALSYTVNVAQYFPPPSAGVLTLRWRIGARNSRDLVAPRTDPGIAQAYPQDQGYVWGTPGQSTFTFTAGASSAAAGRAPKQRVRWLGPRP